jgi:hypothetical protein
VRPLVDAPAVPGYEALFAVFRAEAAPANQEASFRAWADGTIREGIEAVQLETEQLQRDGLIDSDGHLLVDLPADMRPGSTTST